MKERATHFFANVHTLALHILASSEWNVFVQSLTTCCAGQAPVYKWRFDISDWDWLFILSRRRLVSPLFPISFPITCHIPFQISHNTLYILYSFYFTFYFIFYFIFYLIFDISFHISFHIFFLHFFLHFFKHFLNILILIFLPIEKC